MCGCAAPANSYHLIDPLAVADLAFLDREGYSAPRNALGYFTWLGYQDD
jgi:hypothetical protein